MLWGTGYRPLEPHHDAVKLEISGEGRHTGAWEDVQFEFKERRRGMRGDLPMREDLFIMPLLGHKNLSLTNSYVRNIKKT